MGGVNFINNDANSGTFNTNVGITGDVSYSAFIQHGVTAGITASVTQTQGQGVLTTTFNEIATVANPNDTVTLPIAIVGRECIIKNNGANRLQIFPSTGDGLGLGVDIPTFLDAGEIKSFITWDAVTWTTGVGSYTRHLDLDIGASVSGPTGPPETTIGTMRGLGFSTDAHATFLNLEIPQDWDGISNMNLNIHWIPTALDPLLAAETVKWDINYRIILPGQAVDTGTVAMITGTYTQSGAGLDKEDINTSITMNFADVNQPIVRGGTVFMQLDRDVTADTYTGAGIVFRVDLIYTSNRLPEN